MSDSHAGHAIAPATWEGGASPFAVGHKKLGMWLFIVSDSLTFAALIVAYSYVRVANDWPLPFDFYPAIIFSTVMTLVLLSSSLTMVFGVAAAHAGNMTKARNWIFPIIVGGIAFVVLHATEWSHLIHDGMTPGANAWGTFVWFLLSWTPRKGERKWPRCTTRVNWQFRQGPASAKAQIALGGLSHPRFRCRRETSYAANL